MRGLLAFLLLGAFLVSPVVAGEWTEDGDAPDLPGGQNTVGDGALTAIHGSIGTNDADMYCVDIPDPAAFSATTCGGTSYDTQLCLFDGAGYGVSFDDDDPGGCGLQSTITGRFVGAPGHYLVAISSYDWDPGSAGGDIWADTPYGTERAPDGPGAGGVITVWSGTSYNSGAYTIYLTGANFCGSGVPVQELTFGRIKSMYH
jgi:hypothetical protein